MWEGMEGWSHAEQPARQRAGEPAAHRSVFKSLTRLPDAELLANTFLSFGVPTLKMRIIPPYLGHRNIMFQMRNMLETGMPRPATECSGGAVLVPRGAGAPAAAMLLL